VSTRQLRISDKDGISSSLKAQIGNILQVVFTDSTSQIGKLIAASSTEFVLENMRQKKATHPVSSVAEIYIDSHS
jgi:hypothetical protein